MTVHAFVEPVTRSSLGAGVKKVLMLDYWNLDSHESPRVSEVQDTRVGDLLIFCGTVYNSERLTSSSTNLHYFTVMGHSTVVMVMDLINN